MSEIIRKQTQEAKNASYVIGQSNISLRNAALLAIADGLETNIAGILAVNEIDIINARAKGIKDSIIDRLMLNEQRIKDISLAVRQIAALSDVIGETESWERPNGLVIGRKRVPLGLIGIIYEARPNVTVDAAALCIKTGNAVLLKGGSEALNTNVELVRLMKNALIQVGLPEQSIEILKDTSRQATAEMMKLNQLIDVLIPRGGAELIKTVRENATIPVIETGTGNCHTYIDEFADLKMGLVILINAKCSRPSVCNACETLLAHEKIAKEFLQQAQIELTKKNVVLKGCDKTREIIKCEVATEEDYLREYNDLTLAIKVVSTIDEAIHHINKYNSKHSECIVTKDYNNSQKFLKMVDAAAVYVNASTRFTDGFEFGFGAEIGISTQKLHARGPMGLRELTTIKYIVQGNGQTR